MATGTNGGEMIPIVPTNLARLQHLNGKKVEIKWIRRFIRTIGGDAATNEPNSCECGEKEHQLSGILIDASTDTVTVETPDGEETLPYREECYNWQVGYIGESGTRWITSVTAGSLTLLFSKDPRGIIII